MKIIDQSIVKKLKLPKPNSHKGDNGRLLIIAGSKKYHGSLVYAIKAASRIVDLVYVLTTRENQELVRKLKSKTAEFIPLTRPTATLSIEGRGEGVRVDCVLIGPGMGVSKQTYKLVEKVLKSKIKAVLDADALNVMDEKLKKYLNKNHILTPHKIEFKRLSGKVVHLGRTKNLEKFVKQYNCTLVLKGKTDIVCSPDRGVDYNYTGNAGMTKGGTGDVLAGLIAALYCKNDAYTSAAVSAYINGLAGDELYKKVGPFYSAEDLVEEIPKTLWRLIKISN